MSAVQRSSRSRLKQIGGDHSPSSTENIVAPLTGRRKLSNSHALDKRKAAIADDLKERAHNNTAETPSIPLVENRETESSISMNDNTDQDQLASEMDVLPRSPQSTASSSSLSEVVELVQSERDSTRRATMEPESEDNETEAETERLEDTPQKLRHSDPSRSRHIQQDSNGEIDSPAADEAETSTIGIAGRKRKRTSSATLNGGSTATDGPAPKRSASYRESSRSARSLQKMASLDEVAVEDDTPENLSNGMSADDIGKPMDPPLLTDIAVEDTSGQEAEDNEEGLNTVEDSPDSPGEVEDNIIDDGDEDAAEAAARNEDEAAKKKSAMDSLKPIENLFAIFRDRLFDERLALISAELEILTQPNTTHPDYLSMRQCIDARRDEKIHLEQVALTYRIKALENKCMADRAQSHSQYFQVVREVRDAHIEKLYEQQCRIKREMRQWNKEETDFNYLYDPNRALLVTQQQAYNTEVSLLSGIARHVGFPAAPSIKSLSHAIIEEDLRKMKVKPQANSFITHIANSRAATAAAEEQFLEDTPWANPNHPVVQQAVIIERQVSAQQSKNSGSYSSPTHWMADLHNTPAGVPPSEGTMPSTSPTFVSSGSMPAKFTAADGRQYLRPSETGQPQSNSSYSDPVNHEELMGNSDPAVAAIPRGSQILPTSTARSEQHSESFDNPGFGPRPGTFGTESNDASIGEGQPVKHEDDHERYPFAAIPGREPHFGPRALSTGLAMERFGVR